MIWIARAGSPAVISTQVGNHAVAWFMLFRHNEDGSVTPAGQRTDTTDLDSDAVFRIATDATGTYELRLLPSSLQPDEISWSMKVMQSGEVLPAFNNRWDPVNGENPPHRPVELPPVRNGVASATLFDVWFE